MVCMKVLAIPGSFRRGSYNRALALNAKDLAPEGIEVEIFDLDGIPPFNQDLEEPPPEGVIALKEKVRSADALLFCTPEYNYSVPGVLKNAIDWASRPFEESPFEEKPVAIAGASTGSMGTSRAQYHLRQICVGLGMHALVYPELLIPNAEKKFDEHGRIVDERLKEKLTELLESLRELTAKLKCRNAQDGGG
ncbi:MAG: NAD(P)H-dependent oxidoreductase [Candidatus Methanosuratincola petrocarbonis]